MEAEHLSSKARRMFALIEEWQESGLTQKELCHQRGVNYAKFQYWLRKYRAEEQEKGTGDLLPVAFSDGGAEQRYFELLYSNRVTLRVPANTSYHVLRGLIGLL